MFTGSALLLIGAVAAVGVLHTIVPDHWVPIALVARQRGWSSRETAFAALQAGTGHALSTLAIALIVWFAGVAVADRFGHLVDLVSSAALIALGGWIAISAWRELHHEGSHGHSHGGHSHGHGRHGHSHADHGHDDHGPGHHEHDHEPDDSASVREARPQDDPLYAPLRGDLATLTRHAHIHRHGRGSPHLHWHDHRPGTAHAAASVAGAPPPLHEHRHKTTARTALLLILGSSPMIEGIPAFFAAAKYGIGLLAIMAIIFAASTIATYVLLCVYSTAGLQRLQFGAFERYGEVLSGGLIAMVGVVFWIWPVL